MKKCLNVNEHEQERKFSLQKLSLFQKHDSQQIFHCSFFQTHQLQMYFFYSLLFKLFGKQLLPYNLTINTNLSSFDCEISLLFLPCLSRRMEKFLLFFLYTFLLLRTTPKTAATTTWINICICCYLFSPTRLQQLRAK